MFKARTIVEFIENAVETSRSGRYLFFLNLRPVLGPVRVQLLYPVSRFMRAQSLQHMCRYTNQKLFYYNSESNTIILKNIDSTDSNFMLFILSEIFCHLKNRVFFLTFFNEISTTTISLNFNIILYELKFFLL